MRRNILSVYIVISAVVFFILALPVSAADTDAPYIFMSEYQINDGSSDTALAGNFTLNYTLSNPSGIGIANAVLVYDQKSLFIIPVPGSANVEYIGDISAGEKYKGSLELYIPKAAEAGICKLDLTISYNSNDSSIQSLLTKAFSIYINIENNTELSLTNVELSDETTTGERKRLLIEYENPGSRDFKNLKLMIDGNIKEQQKIQMLPILKAGKKNSIEYYLQFSETGEQILSVYIYYDDDAGNSYKTPIVTKSVTISESSTIQPSLPATPSEGYISGIINKLKKFIKTPKFAVLIILLIAAVVAIIIIAPRVRRRAKRKKWYYKDNNGQNGG